MSGHATQRQALRLGERVHDAASAAARVARALGHVPVRPGFVLREIAAGLRRHVGTAVAIVMTATLSLVMLGGALVLDQQISTLKGAWYDKTQVAVYLREDASGAQVAAVGRQLREDDAVQKVYFEDKAEAYENFARQFAGSPALVDQVSAEQLPRSYRVDLVDPASGSSFVASYSDDEGVRQVVDEHAQLSKLFRVMSGFQSAALVLACIQAFAAAVLVSNMVRSAVLLRRRELAIGRLMGASQAQLAVPFLAEVALAGAFGTAAAVGLLALGKWQLLDQRLSVSGLLDSMIGTVSWSAVWAAVPTMAACGVGVPVLVAALAVHRSLRS